MAFNVTKDPQAVLDYTLDWSLWLDGDTISTSTWALDVGITEDSESETATTTTVWVSGGTAGTTYNAVNTITTVGLRTDQRTIQITVQEQ